MRLYSLTGAASVHRGGTQYEPADDGGFDFPPDLAGHMHGMAVDGQRQWETAIERQNRLLAEEEARMRDPATLAALVAELVKGQSAASAPAKAGPKAAPAARAADGK